MPFRMILAALRAIFANFGLALRLFVPFVVLAILPKALGFKAVASEEAEALLRPLLIVLSCVALLGGCIAWHRFLVLGERPTGWLPDWRWRRSSSYALTVLLPVGLLFLLALLRWYFLNDRIGPWSLDDPYLVAAAIIGLPLHLCVFASLPRLGLNMVDAAIRETPRVRLVLARSSGRFWSLLLLYVLTTVLVIVPNLLSPASFEMVLLQWNVEAAVWWNLFWRVVYPLWGVIFLATMLSLLYRDLILEAGAGPERTGTTASMREPSIG